MIGLKEKIGRNTGYTFLAHFLKLAVGFALLPYIVSRIGGERFGLWVIVAVVTQYCGLADLGIAHPLSKYIAEYYARLSTLIDSDEAAAYDPLLVQRLQRRVASAAR